MKKRRKLNRGVAIVGAGMSQFGMFKDKDSKDLFAEVFKEMLASVEKGVDHEHPETIRVGTPLTVKFIHGQRDDRPITYLAVASVTE